MKISDVAVGIRSLGFVVSSPKLQGRGKVDD
jgi:hypothetical protein